MPGVQGRVEEAPLGRTRNLLNHANRFLFSLGCQSHLNLGSALAFWQTMKSNAAVTFRRRLRCFDDWNRGLC